jgi:hypothetical protein
LVAPRDFTFGERPGVTLSLTALTFGNQITGATSAAQVVAITNSGNKPLTITAVVTTGEYVTSSQCSGPLAPGLSCSLNVAFSPKGAGARAGQISIETNAPGSPHLILLAGVGVNVAATSPSIETFYDTATADYRINYTVNLAAYPSVMMILNDKTIFTQGEPFTPGVFVVPFPFPAAFGLMTQIDPLLKRAAFKVVLPVESYGKFEILLNGDTVFSKSK